jgi:integrase
MAIKAVTHPETGELGYRIRVSLGKFDGKQKFSTSTIYGITATQALKIESQKREAANRAKAIDSVADVYKAFIKHKRKNTIKLKDGFAVSLKKPGASRSDAKRHQKSLYWADFVAFVKNKHPLVLYMGDLPLTAGEDYIAFIREHGFYLDVIQKKQKKLSDHTLNAALKTCKKVFKALRHEVEIENPFDDIAPLPEKHVEREAYTFDQIKIIMEKADAKFLKPLFIIGLFTGLSEGDVCTLKKCEIDFERKHIYHERNKTGAMSSIPMLPVLYQYLEKLCCDPENETEYVLPEHNSIYTSKRYEISRDIKDFLEDECGFETTKSVPHQSRRQSVLDFHSLRHTFCTIAGVVGIPLTVVQSIVGHMTPKMTMLYSRHVDEQARLHWINLFGEKLKELPLGIENRSAAKKQNADDLYLKIKNISGTKLAQIMEILQ